MTGGQESAETATATLVAENAGKLAAILLETVTALARAGDVEAACRFAGRACVALRHSDPALARRFDVLLHRLTPALTW